jgi:serine protease Do
MTSKTLSIGLASRPALAAMGLTTLLMLGSAPAAADNANDLVRLRSGVEIQGQIVKRNDRHVWIDIGPDVLRLSVEDIDDIETGAAVQEVRIRAESLYHTAINPPELSPREHAQRIGASVIVVQTPSGLGSGVIINPRGHAITNAHVIQGETSLRVTVWLPERGQGADRGTGLRREVIRDIEIIAVNNHLDLALLRIIHPDGPEHDFTFAPMERDESIEVGQPVFAIGNPLGLERTLSQGVVSTTQRSFDGLTYIQTDTAVNPGNSGGPLFNTKGEVIGITNMGAIFFQGLNFAIPTRYVKDFIRNREAFAFDPMNPNSGNIYHQPPPRRQFEPAPQLRDGDSGS